MAPARVAKNKGEPTTSAKRRLENKSNDDQDASASATEGDAEGSADAARFEESLSELEALVDRLEQGDLSLEESLAAFERGVHLSRGCQRALDAAEQRVRLLTESSLANGAAAGSAAAEPAAFAPGSSTRETSRG